VISCEILFEHAADSFDYFIYTAMVGNVLLV